MGGVETCDDGMSPQISRFSVAPKRKWLLSWLTSYYIKHTLMISPHLLTVSNDFAFFIANYLRISSLDMLMLLPKLPWINDETVFALSYSTLLSWVRLINGCSRASWGLILWSGSTLRHILIKLMNSESSSPWRAYSSWSDWALTRRSLDLFDRIIFPFLSKNCFFFLASSIIWVGMSPKMSL